MATFSDALSSAIEPTLGPGSGGVPGPSGAVLLHLFRPPNRGKDFWRNPAPCQRVCE